MATTTPNLGLTLPAATDNVSRTTINTNFSLIDTAFGGGADITSQLSAVRTGDTIYGYAFQLGKIVIFGVRLTLGTTLSGSAQLISGFPIPIGTNNIFAIASSRPDFSFFMRYQDGILQSSANSGSVNANNSITLSGTYIAA